MPSVPDVADLLRRLRAVRTVRFTSEGGAAAGWAGVGEGSVEVADAPGGGILFRERGTWRPAGGGAFGFSNAYRWTPIGEAMRLEHLRFGPDRPVLLFDLIPAGGAWREASPHVCGEDHYAATLSIVGVQLIMEWTITGPRKREAICYTYQ